MIPRRVLWIDLDDLGWGILKDVLEIGRAPQIGALLDTGRTYTRFWAADVCSPFRARVMTGLDAYRQGNGIGDAISADDSVEMPAEHALTVDLPGRSRHRGKWHLSADPTHPIRCGFDAWSGNLFGVDHDYHDWPKWQADASGEQLDPHHTVYATEDTARDALLDVEIGIDFVHVSFNAIHDPLHVPPPYPPGAVYGPGKPYRMRMQMLACLDWFVGRLARAAIERDYVCFLACDNGTVKAGKKTMYERGLNTPFVVAGKGVLAGRSARLVQATDLFATLRMLRGLAPVAAFGDALDSVPFLDDFLPGPNVPVFRGRTHLTCDDFSPLGGPPDPFTWRRAVRDERWKLLRLPSSTPAEPYVDEFYDLDSDPNEAHDLFDGPLAPEARDGYRKLVAKLPTLG